MTWRELVAMIQNELPENMMDEQAYVFDCSMNNNSDGHIVPVVDFNSLSFGDNQTRDLWILCNSEDWI